MATTTTTMRLPPSVSPAAGASGARFTVTGTGCPAPAVVTLDVAWPLAEDGFAPSALAEGISVAPGSDGLWSVVVDSSTFLHWVVGEGPMSVNGLGAIPGEYAVAASCGALAYASVTLTVTDAPRRYPVNPNEPFPGVIVALDDDGYRDLDAPGMAARGSGCVVAGDRLPDGVWFGFLDSAGAATVSFDLACLFVDEGVSVAALEDGVGVVDGQAMRVGPDSVAFLAGGEGDLTVDRHSVYVRNHNPLVFTVPVFPQATVWPLRLQSATAALADVPESWAAWQAALECSEPWCGAWLYVEDGMVSAVRALQVPAPAPSWIADYIEAAWPDDWAWGRDASWVCQTRTIGPVEAGSILSCSPIRELWDDGQYPVLTVVVLDDAGRLAITQAGVQFPLNTGEMEEMIGPGKTCEQLLADESRLSRFVDDPRQRYLGVLLYWLVWDQPPGLDPDGDGRPCEDLVAADIVDAVFSGGWFGPGG